jgi:hypothetical protein
MADNKRDAEKALAKEENRRPPETNPLARNPIVFEAEARQEIILGCL